MGIAQDKYGRNQGYWLWSCHPYDIEGRPQRTFVPARDLIHVYAQDRVRGVRGIPWMSAVHVSINMLGSLWTSELGNANAQSRIVGMITSKDGMTDPNEDPDSASADNPTGTGADPVAAAANIDIEDASFIGVPAGLEVTFPQSTSPNPALNAFTTELLRSIATGLGVSYHSLTGDVSQANYSSARVALIEERDGWRKQQKWFIAAVMEPVFKAWLEMAILSGAIQIPGWSFDKIYKPQWFPRTWQFLDPEKDARASALLIKTGLSKYRDELGSLGLNWRKHLREIKEEQDFIKELGIELSLDTAGGISPQQDQSQGNTNDTVTPNDGVVPFKKVAP
jgi:lambda family phage portal protein